MLSVGWINKNESLNIPAKCS